MTPERDGEGPEVGRERHEHLDRRELQPAVEHEREHVQQHHRHGETAEEAVQVLEPRGIVDAAQDAGGEQDAPHHREGQQRPRDERARARDVPPQVRVVQVHAYRPQFVDACMGAVRVDEEPRRADPGQPREIVRRRSQEPRLRERLGARAGRRDDRDGLDGAGRVHPRRRVDEMVPLPRRGREASLAPAGGHDRAARDPHRGQVPCGVERVLDAEQPRHPVRRPTGDDDVPAELGHDAQRALGEHELGDEVGGEPLADAAGVEGRAERHPHLGALDLHGIEPARRSRGAGEGGHELGGDDRCGVAGLDDPRQQGGIEVAARELGGLAHRGDEAQRQRIDLDGPALGPVQVPDVARRQEPAPPRLAPIREREGRVEQVRGCPDEAHRRVAAHEGPAVGDHPGSGSGGRVGRRDRIPRYRVARHLSARPASGAARDRSRRDRCRCGCWSGRRGSEARERPARRRARAPPALAPSALRRPAGAPGRPREASPERVRRASHRRRPPFRAARPPERSRRSGTRPRPRRGRKPRACRSGPGCRPPVAT